VTDIPSACKYLCSKIVLR